MIVNKNTLKKVLGCIQGCVYFQTRRDFDTSWKRLIEAEAILRRLIDDNKLIKPDNKSLRAQLEAKTGEKNAKKLLNLVEKYNISVRIIMQAAGINHMKSMLEMPIEDFSQLETELVLDKVFEICNIVKCKTTRLLSALIGIVTKGEYDHERMISKLEKQLDRYHYCNTREAYKELFQNIYNYKSSDKVYFVKEYK